MEDIAYCPNCGAILNEQCGFDPDGDMWTCASCGMALFEPDAQEGQIFEGVFWVCDNCGASLSSQPGFYDDCGEWSCHECGYTNRISESEILEDGEEWDQLAFDSSSESAEGGRTWASDDYDYREIDNFTRATRDRAQALRELNDEIERRERREERARRREFVKGHWKGILIACGSVLLLIMCAFAAWEYQKLRTVGIDSSGAVGQSYRQVVGTLQDAGFTDVTCRELYDLGEEDIGDDGKVSKVIIAGSSFFWEYSRYPYDVEIVIQYHSARLVSPPFSCKEVAGRDYRDVEQGFRDAGFFNVRTEARNDSLVNLINKVNAVGSVSIDGDEHYPDGQEYRVSSDVIIYYHAPVFGGGNYLLWKHSAYLGSGR